VPRQPRGKRSTTTDGDVQVVAKNANGGRFALLRAGTNRCEWQGVGRILASALPRYPGVVDGAVISALAVMGERKARYRKGCGQAHPFQQPHQ